MYFILASAFYGLPKSSLLLNKFYSHLQNMFSTLIALRKLIFSDSKSQQIIKSKYHL